MALSSLGRRHHACAQRRVSKTRTRGLCSLDAEALPSPLLFCWAGAGVPKDTQLNPAMASSLQASALLLKHPETGLHCVPLVRTALSLKFCTQRTSRGFHKTQNWNGPELTAPWMSSRAACYHPYPRGEHSRFLGRQSGCPHSSRSSRMASCHTAGTPQQQKKCDSSAGVTCSLGHRSLCCPSDTLRALAPSRRPCRREAACWAAAESV